MTITETNGIDLRTFSPREEKAATLHARGVPLGAIVNETGLTADQITVAVERHAAWAKLRSTTRRGPAPTSTPDGADGRMTIGKLLDWAETSGQTRAMTLAVRIRAQLAELSGIRSRNAERAQAEADVERLTAEPAAAKARLKDAAAGKPGSAPSTQRPAGATPDPERKAYLATVRAWCAEVGRPVNGLGRIPKADIEAYHAANGGTPQ